MTREQAAVLRLQLEDRWPQAADVRVAPDAEGARVEMTVEGEHYRFSVAPGGTILRWLLGTPEACDWPLG